MVVLTKSTTRHLESSVAEACCSAWLLRNEETYLIALLDLLQKINGSIAMSKANMYTCGMREIMSKRGRVCVPSKKMNAPSIKC